MAFKNLPLWAALLFTVTIVNTLPTQHNIKKRGRMRLCGSMLVQALSIVCYNTYHGPRKAETTKRNFVYSGDNILKWDSSFPESDGFLRPQTALDFFTISNEPRNTRGVVDECCKKPCTIQTLMSYCGDPVYQEKK